MSQNSANKKKKLGLLACIGTGIGAIIGSGIFGAIPEAVNLVGAGMIPALILAAIYTICVMFPNVFASSVIPATGSFFLHSTKLIHPFFGVWQTLQGMLQPALIGVFATMFASYFVILFPSLSGHTTAVAAIMLLVFGALAWMGNNIFAKAGNVMVVVMLLALAVYIFLGMPHADMSKIAFGDVFKGGVTLTTFSTAIGLFTSTLSGAGSVSQIADDLENPKRDIPLTLIIAPALVCVIYILMGVVTLGNMPDGALTDLATVGQTYLGRGLLTFFIVGGPLCGIMTSIIPVMMLSCAMIQTSAEHGVFPEVVARKNKNGVSTIVLIYVIALTEFLVLSGKGTGELMVMFSFVNTACAVPTCLVPFYLKKRYPNSCDYAGLKIPYKLVVTLSGFALVVSVYLAITMLIGLDTSSWVLILIMVAVTILYFFVRVAYIKSHGGNLLADLRAPYQPWEEQEAKCKAMNEAKAK